MTDTRPSKMRESDIERRLISAVQKEGGLCLKFAPPGMVGFPDRLVLLPGGLVVFVEVKKPGKKPTNLQVHRHGQLRSLGMRVYLLDDQEQIKNIMRGGD